MKNLVGWAKGLGIIIGSAIAFSVTSAIAKIHQDATLASGFKFALLAVDDGTNEKLAVLSLLANPETEMNVTECSLQWCDDCCPGGCWICV